MRVSTLRDRGTRAVRVMTEDFVKFLRAMLRPVDLLTVIELLIVQL